MKNTFVEYNSQRFLRINFMSLANVGDMLYNLYIEAKLGIEVENVTIIKMK